MGTKSLPESSFTSSGICMKLAPVLSAVENSGTSNASTEDPLIYE